MRKELARYCDRMKIVFKLLLLTVYPGVVRFLRPEEGDDVFTPSAGINVGVLF